MVGEYMLTVITSAERRNMKKGLAALAAIMALSGGVAAHAATYTIAPDSFDGTSGTFGHSNITGSFADEYDFMNSVAGTYDVTLSTASSGLKFTTMTFDGETFDHLLTVGTTSYYGLTDVAVAAGTQLIDVAGTYTGRAGSTGSYDGTVAFTVSPAPEPSAWVLMLAGVGGIGLALRLGRRERYAVRAV